MAEQAMEQEHEAALDAGEEHEAAEQAEQEQEEESEAKSAKKSAKGKGGKSGAKKKAKEANDSDSGGDEGPHRATASAAPPAKVEQTVAAKSSRGRSLGNFLLTHYTFALESDPKHKGSPKVTAPGLGGKKYKQSFLGSPYGIKMQGTGLADDGKYIMYAGNGTYKYGVGGAGGTPHAWKTVAVDRSLIKLGTKLIIQTYKDKGVFEAKDTGGAIKGHHIDVFAGAIPIAQAYALGTKHSEVFLAEGGDKEDDHHTGGGGGGGGSHTGGSHTGGSHTGGSHTGGAHAGGAKGHDAPSLQQVRAGHAVIKRGMQGDSVKYVQKAVHTTQDGDFGPITERHVKDFQKQHHLEVDGVVGPHTMAAIDKANGHKPDKNDHDHDGDGKGGKGGKGGGKDDVPEASGSDPVSIARKYVTHPPTPSYKLKGKLPHFTAAGGQTNNCADFVSSVLETAGRVRGHHINVGEFERSLLAQGWHHVNKAQAKAGDVWMNQSRGHTELVSADHAARLIGSNNDRPGHQVVTETNGYDGVFLHKNFQTAGHKDDKKDEDKGKGDKDSGGKDKDSGGKGGGDKSGKTEADVRSEVMSKARSHLNARYYWGAEGPSMFDCSGFAWYVLHTDMHLTTGGRTTAAGLSHAPYTTAVSHPEKGDLVFYAGSSISHVTIATGDGSNTIGAGGGGSHTFGNDPNAKVKYTDWNRDRRRKSFGSIQKLIDHKLQQQRH